MRTIDQVIGILHLRKIATARVLRMVDDEAARRAAGRWLP
jgi:hypothetical protein